MKGLKPWWRVHSKSETTFGFKKNSISKLEDEKLSISHIEFSRILVAASLMKSACLLMRHFMSQYQVFHPQSYLLITATQIISCYVLFKAVDILIQLGMARQPTRWQICYCQRKKLFQITRWNSLKIRPW